jgi:hypothetical protein
VSGPRPDEHLEAWPAWADEYQDACDQMAAEDLEAEDERELGGEA